MIEINLLPGAGRKSRGKTTGFDIKTVVKNAGSSIKDPFLLAAVAGVVLAVGAVGVMQISQSATARSLARREEQAVKDSARFAAVIKERRRAEAQRDSVRRQLEIIKSIDNDRYVWPHVLDEVSRALPPYTWLKRVEQAVPVAPPAQPVDEKDKKRKDPEPVADAMKFKIIGYTVDIQALTRFMKLLETSPFVQNVTLTMSKPVQVDGREATEFELSAEYQRPDPSAVTTVPVSLSVR
jgi:type IV pilus assembly protein PilN